MVGYCVNCGINHLGHDFFHIDDPSLIRNMQSDLEKHIREVRDNLQRTEHSEQLLRENLREILGKQSALLVQMNASFGEIIEKLQQKKGKLAQKATSLVDSIGATIRTELESCSKAHSTLKTVLDELVKFQTEFAETDSIESFYGFYKKYPACPAYESQGPYSFEFAFALDPTFSSEIDCLSRMHIVVPRPAQAPPELYFFKEFSKDIYTYNISSENWAVREVCQMEKFHNFSYVYASPLSQFILIGCTASKSLLLHINVPLGLISSRDLEFPYSQ